jgi:hypothetical protein
MRTNRFALASCALLAGFAAYALAGDAPKAGGPVPQKTIASPLLADLSGTWVTESTSTHDGQTMKSTGKVEFSKALGDTAFLQAYESHGPGPDGGSMDFFGHGVYKVSDDGKTLTIWWFCNMSPDVLKLTGPITDTGFDASGTSPNTGGKMTVSMKKSGDGYAFSLVDGPSKMDEVYKRGR